MFLGAEQQVSLLVKSSQAVPEVKLLVRAALEHRAALWAGQGVRGQSTLGMSCPGGCGLAMSAALSRVPIMESGWTPSRSSRDGVLLAVLGILL